MERKAFLGWKYSSNTMSILWNNPFIGRPLVCRFLFSEFPDGKDSCKINEISVDSAPEIISFLSSYNGYIGCEVVVDTLYL